MSGKRRIHSLAGAGKGIVLKEPLSPVCVRGRYLAGNAFGRIIVLKYQMIPMRIKSGQLLFLKTAKASMGTTPEAAAQKAPDHVQLDIRAAAELRMEVIHAVTEHISSVISYCPSYQEMVFFRLLMEHPQRSYTGNYSEEVLIQNEAAAAMFLRLIQEVYLTMKRGGKAGIRYWMKPHSILGAPGVWEEEEEGVYDSHQRRRFETEVLSYLRKQQETLRDESEQTRSYRSEELYYLRRETEILEETGTYQQQEQESLRELHFQKLREEVMNRSTTEVHRAVEQQVVQRLDSLSDKVYTKLEKRMENEKKRRGI